LEFRGGFANDFPTKRWKKRMETKEQLDCFEAVAACLEMGYAKK
jgi:hypothetical protein